MAFNQKEKEIIQWGLQNGKSQQQVEQAISKYRMGAISQPQQTTPQTTETTPSFIQRVGEDIKKAGETIVDTMNSTEGSALKRGTEMTATAFNVIPQVAYESLPEPARKGLDFIGKQIGRGFELLTDKLASTKLLSEVASLEQQGFINKEQNPTLYKVLDSLGTASASGQIAGDILMVDQGVKGMQKGVDITKTGVNKVKQGIVDTTKEFKGDLSKTGTQISDKLSIAPNSIMNKVARVTPKEAQTFKSMTGKDIGTYLTEKGNFNSPTKIVSTEAETFAKTLADKEATLSKLQGNFKSGIINDVLDQLQKKALSTSTKNVKAPYLKQVETWMKKAKAEGLTMEEINNAKKLFEREVKLGYNKLTDATGIKQATYLDDALRAFQDETASKLGFTNIKELSKQIQASKFIVDKLGNKLVSNDLLNGVSLTDYIILAGGEPASVGAFLTKKLFSNKAIQAKIAKLLSKGEVKAPVKANYSPQATKATQSKNMIKKGISSKSTTKKIKVK